MRRQTCLLMLWAALGGTACLAAPAAPIPTVINLPGVRRPTPPGATPTQRRPPAALQRPAAQAPTPPPQRADTAAMQAVVRKDLPALQKILTRNRQAATPALLGQAVILGSDPAFIQAIAQAGVDVNAGGPGGFPPLFLAIMQRRAETVRVLLACGAKAGLPYRGMSPLYFAVVGARTAHNPKDFESSLGLARALLDAGANPDQAMIVPMPSSTRPRPAKVQPPPTSWTPLQLASMPSKQVNLKPLIDLLKSHSHARK